MFKKLDKKAIAIPIVLLIAMAIVFSTMFYPMTHMSLSGLKFAIVSLDEGVKTDEGDVNLGNLMVDQMLESVEEDGEDAAIVWTEFDNQEELDEAMASGEYYGALVVPADFSQTQYDSIIDMMSEQMANMTDSLGDLMGDMSSMFDPSSLGSSLDTSSLSSLMGAGTSSSAAPSMDLSLINTDDVELSKEQKSALANASAGAAKLKEQVAALQKLADNTAAAQQQAEAAMTAMKEQIASDEATLEESNTALTELKDIAEEERPEGYEEQVAALEEAIAALETKIEAEEQKLTSVKATAEQTAKMAQIAAGNLAAAQGNATVAGKNVEALTKTTYAAAAMAAAGTTMQETMQTKMQSAMSNVMSGLASNLQDSLSGALSGGFEMSDEQRDEMAASIASKTINEAAETLKNGSDDEEEDDEDSGSSITVYLDMAKSPMIANTLKSSFASMLSSQGMSAETVMLNEGYTAADDDDDKAASNPMSSMMGQNVAIMPLMMLSAIGSIMLARGLNRRKVEGGAKGRAILVGLQIVYAAAFTAAVAIVSAAMLICIGGTPAPWKETFLFFWAASACISALAIGLANISIPLSVLVSVLAVVLGMSMGMFPYDILPGFWQEWVFPWSPQRFIGEGLRGVIYLCQQPFEALNQMLLIYGAVGLILMLISIALPTSIGPKRGKKTQVEDAVKEAESSVATGSVEA